MSGAGTGSIDSISGIGPTYADRLASQGIETVDELLSATPAEIARVADASETKAYDWSGQARVLSTLQAHENGQSPQSAHGEGDD